MNHQHTHSDLYPLIDQQNHHQLEDFPKTNSEKA